MIKSISFTQYRRLKAPLNLEFSPNINAISGLNGTCKSSILYLISNAFQAEKSSGKLKMEQARNLKLLNALTPNVNPKIETLTKGDKDYNDPAYGATGSLYTIEYIDNSKIDFRRHNSKSSQKTRFRLIPKYTQSGQKLPVLRVVYLNLARLLPYGEISDNIKSKIKTTELPEQYADIFHSLVNQILGINIVESKPEIIDGLKTRSDYKTTIKGIDSNTSSAGEDNAIIILRNLVLLRYYYEQLSPEEKNKQIASILLIDELEATLHPALQIKLFSILLEYSKAYKIQIFFTTHSLYLLNIILKNELTKVNYLVHQGDHVCLLENPSIYKIEAHLSETQSRRYIETNKIPIFSEDQEARLLIQGLFGFFRTRCQYFKKIEHHFELMKMNLGCNNLIDLFSLTILDRNVMNAICVLDGDVDDTRKKNTKRNIIKFPGKKSPEDLIFEYANTLYKENDSKFWYRSGIMDQGFTRQFFEKNIQPKLNELTTENNGKKPRERNKKLFNEYHFKAFFEEVYCYWLEQHHSEVEQFYKDLRHCFRKVALVNNIDPELWPNETKLSTQPIPEYN